MNIVEKLRLMQTDHIPELGEAIAEIEHLRREAHAWSKACEDATTKLYKLSTHHPRLEVRYWTGKYWEPLYGARFHEVLNALDLTPNASFSREPERSGGESAGSVCWAPTLEIGMTPVDLIADLRSRINPAYANQIGTESWERKLCADALEEQASAIDLLHSWEAEAKARAGLLEQHLRAVLEVARVWQPDYATEMDRDTLRYAQECADGKVPNEPS